MMPRAREALPPLLCAAALLLGPTVARADVSSGNDRIVPSEAVFTGLGDFPAYRFVLAVIPFSGDSWKPENGGPQPPPPLAVREGEVVSTDTIYFEELRAIPTAIPDPVTDAWLASSRAPSGSVVRHPLRVPIPSGEKMVRAHYQVRQIRSGWISIELISAVAWMADGSQHPVSKPISQTYVVDSITAPPGWKLFFMPDPAWPRADPALPPILCSPGEVLPLMPGPRTLVAVLGAPGPDGSLDGKTFFSRTYPLDAWRRAEVGVDSTMVARRTRFFVEIQPNDPIPLSISIGEAYEDAEGRRFEDESGLNPVETSTNHGRWAVGGAVAAAMMAAGAWALRRRRRRGVKTAPPAN